MAQTVKRGRPSGVAGNARRILREFILKTLAELGGRAKASVVLRAVRDASEPYVPPEWRNPHPPYQSRTELYAAFERANLRDSGLLDATEYGYWKLTPAGWQQAKKIAKAWKKGTAKPTVPLE